MKRVILVSVALLMLAGCKPTERDHRSGVVPPADTPANLTEPASAPAAAPDFAGPIDASGAAPPWILEIRRDSLMLRRPGQLDVLAVNSGPRQDGPRAIWTATAAASGGVLRATLEPEKCSGMSGQAYPFGATVEYGGQILKGCAAPAPAR